MADEEIDDSEEVRTFDVYSVDEDTEEETLIGRVEYGPQGRLGLLDAEPAQAERLASVVDGINRKEVLVEKVSPGPDAPRYSTSSRAVKRTDKEFLPALQRYLRQYYGLSLG
jgi:hypothetical protein